MTPAVAANLARVEVLVPVRTVSEANVRQHWRHRKRRASEHRLVTAALLRAQRARPELPVVVTLTRIGPKKIDSDNCWGALKHVRDGVADVYGVDDGDGRYAWRCEQEVFREYGVRVEIEHAPGLIVGECHAGGR